MIENNINGFSFYRSYYTAIKALKNEATQKELALAIVKYAFEGKLDCSSDVVCMAMELIKPNIDISIKRSISGSKISCKNKNEIKSESNKNQTENNNDNDNDLNKESNKLDSMSGDESPDALETIDYKKLVDWFNLETKGVFGKVKYPLSDNRKKHEAVLKAGSLIFLIRRLFDKLDKKSPLDQIFF